MFWSTYSSPKKMKTQPCRMLTISQIGTGKKQGSPKKVVTLPTRENAAGVRWERAQRIAFVGRSVRHAECLNRTGLLLCVGSAACCVWKDTVRGKKMIHKFSRRHGVMGSHRWQPPSDCLRTRNIKSVRNVAQKTCYAQCTAMEERQLDTISISAAYAKP